MVGDVFTAASIGVVTVTVPAVIAFIAVRDGQRLPARLGSQPCRPAGQRLAGREERSAESESRHERLNRRELSEDAHERYTARWRVVQKRFVDAPAEALGEADELLASVMADRGYPIEDLDRRSAEFSVEHARAISRYRAARSVLRRVRRSAATTENMRQAMVHYRAVFDELVDHVTPRPAHFAPAGGRDGQLNHPPRNDGRYAASSRTDGRFVKRPPTAAHATDEDAQAVTTDADQRAPRTS